MTETFEATEDSDFNFGALETAIAGIGDALSKISQKLDGLSAKLSAVAENSLGGIGDVLERVLVVIGFAATVVGAVAALGLALPIIAAAGILALIIAGLVLMTDELKWVIGKISDGIEFLTGGIAGLAEGAAGAVVDGLMGAAGKIGGMFGGEDDGSRMLLPAEESSSGFGAPGIGNLTEGFTEALAASQALSEGTQQEMRTLIATIEEVEGAVGSMTGAFDEANKEIVQQSIVPDMVTAIGEWFGKLDPLMVKPVQEMGGQVENAFRGMGDNVARSIGNMVKQGKIGFDSLRGAARSLVQDLQSMLIDRLVTAPLRSGFGSFLDGIFPRASGGDVTGGRPFLVGEQGPELFVPKTSGVIRPTNESKGSSRPDVHFHVDMRGASLEAVQRLELFVRQVNGSIETRAITAVNNFNARRL